MTRRTRTQVDAQHLTGRARRATPRKSDGTTQMTTLHYTAGADEPLPDWQTTAATRLVQRQPDAALLLDILGLTTAPPPDRSGQYQTHNGTWVTWTICHECGVRAKVRLDGTFQIHPRAGRKDAGRCPASRRKPQQQPEGSTA